MSLRKKVLGLLVLFSSLYALEDQETVFTSIYENNGWGNGPSKSGKGSSLPQTTQIRAVLPLLLKAYNCKTMIDAPCGDLYWIKTANLPIEKYIGVDIVQKLIEINRKEYEDQYHSFCHLDITKQVLPKADIILCRDCLVHLGYRDIANAIRLFKESGCKYLLTTTFINRKKNKDLVKMGWRPLNLLIEPFNFPEPLEIINENCTEGNGRYADKSLLLWKIDSLPDLDF